jgi:DNA-binding transcriptional regulator YiaG
MKLLIARELSSTGEGRDIRLSAGLSLADVGTAIGRSTATVFRWERGERTPTGIPAVVWANLLLRIRAAGADDRDSHAER